MKDCEESLLGRKHEVSDVMENIRICGTVNSTRQCQVEVCFLLFVIIDTGFVI